MRLVVPGLLVAVVALALWFLLDPEHPRADTPDRPSLSMDAPPAESVPPHAAAAVHREAEPEPPPVSAPASEAESLADEGSLRLHGTVVVVDEAGAEHSHESGMLQVGPVGGTLTFGVPVQWGRFSMIVPAEPLEVRYLELGGRMAVVEEEIPSGASEVTIRARWAAAMVLRVVDAASGVDLDPVLLVERQDWRYDDQPHPGDRVADVLLRGSSPLALSRQHTPGTFGTELNVWVGSPGHVWQPLSLDYSQPTERRCELQRGATLVVLVDGTFPEDSPTLRVRKPPTIREPPSLEEAMESIAALPDRYFPEGRPSEEEVREQLRAESEGSPAAGEQLGEVVLEAVVTSLGNVMLEGIAPGVYETTIEVGYYWDSLVLARAETELEAGGTSRVSLSMVAVPEEVRVPFAGTLFVPPEWGEEILARLSLEMEPLDLPGKGDRDTLQIDVEQMTPVEGGRGLYRWDAREVVSGRQLVSCDPFDVQWVVETGPQGARDVELLIAEPADVTVSIVDDASGEVLPELELGWSCERPPASTGGSIHPADWNATLQAYEFRAPAGPILLSMGMEIREYLLLEGGPFEVRPGPSQITVKALRTCGVTLFMQDGDVLVPWTEDRWEIELECIGAPGMAFGAGPLGDHGHSVVVSTPGRYRVTLPPVPGYEPIAPFEVDIPDGEFVEHVVQLEK